MSKSLKASGLKLAALTLGVAFADPLASWNDGAAKTAIESFVQTVTDPNSHAITYTYNATGLRLTSCHTSAC